MLAKEILEVDAAFFLSTKTEVLFDRPSDNQGARQLLLSDRSGVVVCRMRQS